MSNIPRVSPVEAKRLIDQEGYIHLDVRSEPEYAAGHPERAQNVPLLHAGPMGMEPNPEFLDVILALYPKDSKIVLDCRAGRRSLQAAEIMAGVGYTHLVDQRAGYEGVRNDFGLLVEPGWLQLGLPSETETPGGSYAELRKKAGRG